MATELIKGKSVDEALELTNKAVVEALDGLPPAKIHCSVLAEEAVKTAINDYYKRNGIDKVIPIHGATCDGDCASCGGH
jgi:nitrogen fixation NifU-like protein